MLQRIKRLLIRKMNTALQLHSLQIENNLTTLAKLMNEKCSMSRFGEGEIQLMMNQLNLKFQKYDKQLARRLNEIITTTADEKMMICVPYALKDVSEMNDRAQQFWKRHLSLTRHLWLRAMNSRQRYYDALVTRCYIDLRDRTISTTIFTMFKEIWGNRDIVIVEGRKSRLGIGNDLFATAKSIKRILAPEAHAYSVYQQLLTEAQKIDQSSLILIALGPTATVLAYDLHQLGYQAIDLGHLDIEYEWYQTNADSKQLVKGKFTNEVENGNIVEDLISKEYQDQIIKVIENC